MLHIKISKFQHHTIEMYAFTAKLALTLLLTSKCYSVKILSFNSYP